MQPHVVHVLGGGKLFEEFNGAGGPVGDVARQLFQHGSRALAAAIGNRVGHFGTRRRNGRRHAIQWPVANQVADVGRHPVGAGLDELVVVELFYVFFQCLELPRDQLNQVAQRVALLLVADAINRRQQCVQAISVERAHEKTSAQRAAV